MIISLKNALKLAGVAVVCFCAAFVCTFFLNFYLDVLPLKDGVSQEMRPLYDAQLATAQMCCAITGGILSLISVIMIIFYVKLYVDEHSAELGTLKAVGYSANRLAANFLIFGLSSFVGCAAGYGLGHCFMPFIYDQLTIEGLTVQIHYYPSLLFALTVAPPLIFSAAAYLSAYAVLKKPALDILRNRKKIKTIKIKVKDSYNSKRGFIREMGFQTLKTNKLLTFFVVFSCFCFAAMVQMGMSMENLVSGTMGWMILIIGLVLAAASAFMSMTSLVKNAAKDVAALKAFGYTLKERALAVFGYYVPFAIVGFAIGTVYQYGLLQLMVNVIFKNVSEIPDYNFDVGAFFITFALFAATYALIGLYYIRRLNGISVKEIMLEG